MQMTEEINATHSVPSDLKQIPIVWKYELLKYLRSKRLLASLAIAVVVLGLLYALPPALGQAYSGTDSGAALYMLPAETFPGGSDGPFNPTAAGIINRSQIDVDTLVIYMDGDQYPAGSGANWFVSKLTFEGQSVYVVFFMQDVAGHVMTASYEWYTAAESFETLFLNFAGILVVVCATFFGADALVSEFQNRTGYLIFPNPVRREVLFFGKFAASMTAGILVMTLFYGVLAGLSAYTARGIDDDYILSYAFALEYLLAVMAVAYLISTLLKGTTGATVLTFFLFIMILPIVDGISLFTGSKVEASVTFASGALIYILMDPYPVDWTQEFPGGFTISNFYPDPSTAAIVMLGYAVVAVMISLVLFKRKQLVG